MYKNEKQDFISLLGEIVMQSQVSLRLLHSNYSKEVVAKFRLHGYTIAHMKRLLRRSLVVAIFVLMAHSPLALGSS